MIENTLFWKFVDSIGYIFDINESIDLPLNGMHYVLNKKGTFGYIGEYSNGLFDGRGILFSPDEIIYKGDFKKGRFHGFGILYEQSKETDKRISIEKYPFSYERILNDDIEYNAPIKYEGLFFEGQISNDWSKFSSENIEIFENKVNSIIEGNKLIESHIRYERSIENKLLALEIHGKKCKICGFEELEIDGIKYNCIEVHHIIPISSGIRTCNPQTDLIPLCSNCHTLVHKLMQRYENPIEIIMKHLTTAST